MNGIDGMADIKARLDRLESEKSIRRLVAHYFQLCDRLGPDVAPQEIAALFCENAQWRGKGGRYAQAFGELFGREAIVAMLEGYCGPPPHFRMNAHFLSGESIRVRGDSGRGSWMMLQTSAYHDGSCDLRAAKLELSFLRHQGEWQISVFETENIFSRRVDRWDDAAPILTPNA
jgi:SnoaL-like domain